jgi:hypothetical protein
MPTLRVHVVVSASPSSSVFNAERVVVVDVVFIDRTIFIVFIDRRARVRVVVVARPIDAAAVCVIVITSIRVETVETVEIVVVVVVVPARVCVCV